MRTIWKYELGLDHKTFMLPESSVIRHAAIQGDGICIWVEQNPTNDVPTMQYDFYVVGTGHPLPTGHATLHYVNTVMQPPFVWHIYYAWR